MPNKFGNGIPLSAGFDIATPGPLDNRTVVSSYMELESMPAVQRYAGLRVYVESDDMFYRWTGSSWEPADNTYLLYQGEPSSIFGNIGNLCIDTDSGDLYVKVRTLLTGDVYWNYVMNIVGPMGDKGDKGSTGIRGSKWFRTSVIDGTVSTGTIFPNSDIPFSNIDDMALNVTNGNVYICYVAGAPDVAEWSYQITIKGDRGEKGNTGDKGDTGSKGATGDTGPQGEIGIGIYTGTAVSGIIEVDTNFPNIEVQNAREDEIYINTNTFDMYQCVIPGAPTVSKWIWINNIGGSLWYSGNKITGKLTSPTTFPSSDIIFARMGDMYLNSETSYVYRCTLTGVQSVATWVYLGSVRGSDGVIGYRGSQWFKGEAMTGMSTVPTIFSDSGISDALVNDMYLNTDTSYVYQCVLPGNAATSKWIYVTSIQGNPKIVRIPIILDPTKWSGTTKPYKQVIKLTYDLNENMDITPIPDPSYDNIKLISDAFIIATIQDNATNSITFESFNIKPAANILYTLKIEG